LIALLCLRRDGPQSAASVVHPRPYNTHPHESQPLARHAYLRRTGPRRLRCRTFCFCDEVQRLQEELAQTTEGRDKALQDMANLGIKHPTAPEQLDEVQGSVEPGDPDSPAAIEMPKKKK